MNSRGPIFQQLEGQLPSKMLALAHSVNMLSLASNELELAHSCLQVLVRKPSHGPINISRRCCRRPRDGPLMLPRAADDDLRLAD
jgi:hypothetical protein